MKGSRRDLVRDEREQRRRHVCLRARPRTRTRHGHRPRASKRGRPGWRAMACRRAASSCAPAPPPCAPRSRETRPQRAAAPHSAAATVSGGRRGRLGPGTIRCRRSRRRSGTFRRRPCSWCCNGSPCRRCSSPSPPCCCSCCWCSPGPRRWVGRSQAESSPQGGPHQLGQSYLLWRRRS